MSRITSTLLLLTCAFLGACTPQRAITGEPTIYGVDPISGAIVDRDLLTRPDNPTLGTIPHEGEMISVVLNSVFIKHLEPLLRSRVLVYAEVYDDASDDPGTAITRVLFDQEGQPEGVSAGLSDRLLYGPTPYKGFPIRIKFFVVELAKEQKQTVGKIIDAVGTIASSAQPEAAPAVGLIVQAAKLVNELTEDAFELRFDMTLYPVAAIGTADLSDPTLAEFNRTNKVNEPVQRQGRAVSLVTPLHVGQYVVIKRELGKRFRRQAGEIHADTVSFDWTQEAFIAPYVDTGGKTVNVQEFVRATGGYLNWWVGKTPEGGVTVVPRTGPNAGVPTFLAPGVRSRLFDDQTYAMFSILNNLPAGLDQGGLDAQSRRDRERIGKMLDNPNDISFSERIGDHVDAVAKSVKTVLEQRRIAQDAAKINGRDPTFRNSTAYPAYWSSRVLALNGPDGKPLGESTVDRENAIAHNRAILPVLGGIVLNFPGLDPANGSQMTALRGLTAADYETFEKKPEVTPTPEAPAPGTPAPADPAKKKKSTPKGMFNLTEAGLKKLTDALNPPAAATPDHG